MNAQVKAKSRLTQSQIVDSLIAVIEQKKGDIPTERKAAKELGRIGSTKAINYLISCMEKRPAAAGALGIFSILKKVGVKAVPQYKRYLDAHVRPGKEGASDPVLLLMWYCADEDFLLYLIDLYKNPNLSDSIKTNIAGYLMLVSRYSHEDVQALIDLIPSEDQYDPDWHLHYAIMEIAGLIYSHKELAPLFEAILRTTNPYWIDFRQEAARALKRIRTSRRKNRV